MDNNRARKDADNDADSDDDYDTVDGTVPARGSYVRDGCAVQKTIKARQKETKTVDSDGEDFYDTVDSAAVVVPASHAILNNSKMAIRGDEDTVDHAVPSARKQRKLGPRDVCDGKTGTAHSRGTFLYSDDEEEIVRPQGKYIVFPSVLEFIIEDYTAGVMSEYCYL